MEDRFKFRVWIKFQIGELISECIETEASWYLLSQSGDLYKHNPMEPIEKVEIGKNGIIDFKIIKCTGLKDKKESKDVYFNDKVRVRKNGKRIFESVISWDRYRIVALEDDSNMYKDKYIKHSMDKIEILEIIGNIHTEKGNNDE